MEGLEAAGEVLDVGTQDALELNERLFVPGDEADIVDGQSLALQAPADGVDGEGGVVLAAG